VRKTGVSAWAYMEPAAITNANTGYTVLTYSNKSLTMGYSLASL